MSKNHLSLNYPKLLKTENESEISSEPLTRQTTFTVQNSECTPKFNHDRTLFEWR